MYNGDVGHLVLLKEPETLDQDQAVKCTRLYQYTKSACHKKAGRIKLSKLTAEDYDESPEICAVTEQPGMSKFLQKMDLQQKQMEEQQKLLTKFLSDQQSRPRRGGNRGRKPQQEEEGSHSKKKLGLAIFVRR